MRDKERAIKAYEELSSALNNMSFDDDAFVAQFMKEHNTLQQKLMRIHFKMMIALADENNWKVDARNEAAVKACKIMVDAYKKETGFEPKHMPTI
jgi:CRISPR/Cas system-associated endonuclease Cas3-HD